MAFKDIMIKFRRALLCCNTHEQKLELSLDIGSPTNVRRVDISDALPGLTDAQRKNIREKASSEAIHLLGLPSQPPSHPPTSPPSPTLTSSSSVAPASREPSEALLNAASKDLPSALPTPPRRRHNEGSPPAARMKSMWTTPKRASSSSSSSSSTTNGGLYEKLERVKGEQNARKGLTEPFMTLNLDFDAPDKKHSSESLRTLDLTDVFETQDTIGGHSQAAEPVAVKTPPMARNKVIGRAITSTSLAESSESEDDLAEAETSPLVKI